jgi:hypothetical protein
VTIEEANYQSSSHIFSFVCEEKKKRFLKYVRHFQLTHLLFYFIKENKIDLNNVFEMQNFVESFS